MLKMILQKNKNVVFVCQFTDTLIKVIKCISRGRLNREIVGLETAQIEPADDEKKLKDKLSTVLQKLGFSNNNIVLSLPRSQITTRYLKIPSIIPQEIERIVNLQASHYLPYSTDELITSYQCIKTDRDGYSNIVLAIAHRDVVNRYINILNELKPCKINIIPSSCGLANLYSHVFPNQSGPVMIADIDSQLVELAIVSQDKLLFSRSFKLNNYTDWESLFTREINKTRDAYFKEVSKEAPGKIIFIGPEQITTRCSEIINGQGGVTCEILHYSSKIKIKKSISDKLINSPDSFASLVGLGLKDVVLTLNLVSSDMKEKENKSLQVRGYLRLLFFVAAIILIWVIAIAKTIDNKERYLGKLRIELAKFSEEAKPLEEIEKKFKLLEDKGQKKSSSLDLIHALFQVMPQSISLTNLSYEEDSKVVLRGRAPELNSVLAFVSNLEKSEIFGKFKIKMRYASQKRTQAGEIVNFEVTCIKK